MPRRVNNIPDRYRRYVQQRLERLRSVFAKAAIGDFSSNLPIPRQNDEFTELYAGVQIMLEVIREQLAELHQRVSQLEERRTQDRAILKSIGEGMIITDHRGTVVMVNPTAEAYLEVPAHRLVGRPWLETVALVDEEGKRIPRSRRPLVRALRSRRKVRTSKYSIQLSGQRKLAVAITISPIIRQGKLIGTVYLMRDIREERAIDRAKSEFVSLASHQLRTPITAVNWYGEMLLDGDVGKLNAKQHEYLEKIIRANQRMGHLVNDLLNVSRIDLGTYMVNPESIDLAPVAMSLLGELKPIIMQKRLHIQERYDRRLPKLKADPTVIRIILQNLLTNAITYTPNGGLIRIGISREAGRSKRGGRVIIQVSDSGIGIPKNQQRRVFDKFFRADNAKQVDTEGNGLGLYLIKNILTRIGGSIWFTSEERRGTTFYVALPQHGMKPKRGTRRFDVTA